MKKLKGKPLPSVFHADHKPLSDEDIGKWKETKQYGPLHEVDFIKESEVDDRLNSPPHLQDDYISTSSSNPEVTPAGDGKENEDPTSPLIVIRSSGEGTKVSKSLFH